MWVLGLRHSVPIVLFFCESTNFWFFGSWLFGVFLGSLCFSYLLGDDVELSRITFRIVVYFSDIIDFSEWRCLVFWH